MVLLKEIRFLLFKELILEFRNKTAISGLLLYVIATIYVCYLSFRKINDTPAWNALYWIIILFSSFNVAGRSFDKEGGGRELYLYSLCSPAAVILSKMVFNGALLFLLTVVSLAVYILLLGSGPAEHASWAMYCAGLLGGSFGLAAMLTLIAGIAHKTDNNIGLTAVLGFPVILPFLMTLIRFTKNALDGISWAVNYQYFLVMMLLNVIILVLGYILFPYLWRD